MLGFGLCFRTEEVLVKGVGTSGIPFVDAKNTRYVVLLVGGLDGKNAYRRASEVSAHSWKPRILIHR